MLTEPVIRAARAKHKAYKLFDERGLYLLVSEAVARMKARREHIVPLSRQAVALLRKLEPVTGNGRFLFPSLRTTARPISENTVNAALRRLGFGQDEMTGHGFRSMASTCPTSRDSIPT